MGLQFTITTLLIIKANNNGGFKVYNNNFYSYFK